MNGNDHQAVDDRIGELLVEWEELRDAGRTPTAEALCRDCPELTEPLAERIERLLRMDAMLGTPGETADETLLPNRQTTNQRIDDQVVTQSAYRVEGFHASGGRARIHVARDERLNRSVAVKSLHPFLAGDVTARQRIEREAEITGRLEHPGVLPVYGIGTGSNGSPFYCMRLVGGETLREAIVAYHGNDHHGHAIAPGQRRLAFARLLRHFVDVCNTVAYAHQHDVLHRDIKPENILLGEFGGTFVVDWGLAKIEGTADDDSRDDAGNGPEHRPEGSTATAHDGNVTRAGSAIGTPAYMSPEQVRGDVDGIGKASDVFNLSATLYTLLTSQAPFGGQRITDVLENAERCTFPTPRATRANVPRPLEAICLQAMARDPDERYASASDLAADVERWLADESVSCHTDRAAVRLARWARRHRTFAASAAVLLTTAIVALAASTVLIGRQKVRADGNFRRARQAVDDSFTKISENKLLRVPGMQPLRTELLAETLKYYREFYEEQKDDPRLTQEFADTALRLGEIYRQIGKADDAVKYLAEARDVTARLAEQNPSGVAQALAHVRSLRRLGQAQLALGNVDLASASAEDVVRLLDTHVQQWPKTSDFFAEGVEAHLLLAGLQWERGDRRDASAAFSAAQADAETLLARSPSAGHRVLFARSLAAHAAVRAEDEEPRQAIPLYERAYELLEEARTESPHDLGIEQMIATVCRSVGTSHAAAEEFADALEWYVKAQQAARILAADYPGTGSFRVTSALIAEDAGFIHLKTGQPRYALEQFEHAYTARRHVGESAAQLRQLIADIHFDLAIAHHRDGRMDEAAQSFRTTRAIYEELDLPLETKKIQPMAGNLLLVGYYQWENGATDRSVATYQETVEILEPRIADAPDHAQLREIASAAWLGLSLAHYQKGELEDSRTATERAIAHLHVAIPRSGQPENTRTGLCCAYYQLEGVLRRLDRLNEADTAAARSAEFRPKSAVALYGLAQNYANYATLVGRGKERLETEDLDELDRYLDRAVVCLQEAIETGLDNAEDIPHDPAFVALRLHPGFRALIDTTP